jgi:hypothetical protein
MRKPRKVKTVEELRASVASSSSPKHRRLYIRRVEQGLCVSCGKVKPPEGRRRCDKCLVRYPGGGTPVSLKAWRDSKVALGLCSKCGKFPHAENRKLCTDCLRTCLDNTRRRLAENPNLSKEGKRKLFLECLDAYGGRRCACCGECSNILFLSLDHINNDGAAHRRSMGHKRRNGGEHVWYWLKKHNFPPGMQVLCMNCNTGKQRNGGICPHQEEKTP